MDWQRGIEHESQRSIIHKPTNSVFTCRKPELAFHDQQKEVLDKAIDGLLASAHVAQMIVTVPGFFRGQRMFMASTGDDERDTALAKEYHELVERAEHVEGMRERLREMAAALHKKGLGGWADEWLDDILSPFPDDPQLEAAGDDNDL